MVANVYIWLFVTLITTLFSLGVGQPTQANCTQAGACKCTFKNGGIIDLSKISGLKDDDTAWKKDIEPTGSSTDYVYSYKPCFDFNEDGTVGGNCNNVASCQKAKGKTDQYSLGTSASAKFMDENGEIKLKYAADPDESSTVRETWVTLKCADGESFEVKGEISGTNSGTAKYVSGSYPGLVVTSSSLEHGGVYFEHTVCMLAGRSARRRRQRWNNSLYCLAVRDYLLHCRWRPLYDFQTRRRGRGENSKFDLLEGFTTADKRWRLFCRLANHEEE